MSPKPKQSLDQFKRPQADAESTVRRSVVITQKQQNFLAKKNLNLSAMVRDFLNKVIGENNG